MIRGLKHRDHFSPILFILATEVMTRALNALLIRKEFNLFGILRKSPNINHLAFTNGMIILCNLEDRTMQLLTKTLDMHERISG